MKRTHLNGKITESNIGQTVTIIGWVHKRRNLGSIVFIDLRDRSGIVQVLVKNDEINVDEIRSEFIISVTGTVSKKDVPNPKLKTGTIEIIASEVTIINRALTTPIIIDDECDALEDTRLKYRYLDLRRPMMQEKLMTRAKIVKATHEYLDAHDFVEVETPILTLSTPEGARDYLVPSRVHPGSFYALPQSPQLFKQLLMIGGMERYYQIAKCFRDEDLRADRQPDFTQIDIETSFLDQDEFLSLMEGLIYKIVKDVKNREIKLPLRRLPYDEAVNTYGSDKPDTRFGLLIHDAREILKNSSFEGFKLSQYIKGIAVPNVASVTTRKVSDDLNVLAKKFGLRGVTVLKCENDVLTGSFMKFISKEEELALIKEFALKNDDILILAASDNHRATCFGLGAIRSHYGRELKLIDEDVYDLLWVVNWPLFEFNEELHTYSSNHHPFTRPNDEHLEYLSSDPKKVYAQAYDLVFNGYEAGGGSLRIYDSKVQKRVFDIIGLTEEEIKTKFGFFIDAFNYGTPPHGGMAFGLDRLAMILANTNNIRDVIAFPKNLSAVCPMSNAPQKVSESQLKELKIKIEE